MAKQTTGENAGEQQPGAGGENAGAAGEQAPKEKKVKLEACTAELRSSAPTARDMFGSFMLSVATRNMPAGEIADTAERLTNMWLERKGKFAAK
jgi:hypothetical protein